MLQVITNLFQGVTKEPVNYTLCDLFRVFENAFNLVFQLSIPIAVIVFIYGGFKIMTAAGDPGKISEGKVILRNAAIGVAILTSAWLIVDTILTIMSGGSISDIIRNIKC